MKTPEQIAQWVINHRYAKSEKEKVSDSEMYHKIVKSIKLLIASEISNNTSTIITNSDYEPTIKHFQDESDYSYDGIKHFQD